MMQQPLVQFGRFELLPIRGDTAELLMGFASGSEDSNINLSFHLPNSTIKWRIKLLRVRSCLRG